MVPNVMTLSLWNNSNGVTCYPLRPSIMSKTAKKSSTKAPAYQSRVLRTPDAIVHIEYDPKKLPPKPSSDWTRFVCISDTHADTFKVPDGDVLLHSGDLTKIGKVQEFEKTLKWLYGMPHKLKIVIAGNHDLPLHEEWYEQNYSKWGKDKQDIARIKELLRGSEAKVHAVVYLQDELHTFQLKPEGHIWSVYGSAWTPATGNSWAFTYSEDHAEALYADFPKADILLTHGPPHGILDNTYAGMHAGCRALRNRLNDLRPRLHLFGHIHEAHGAEVHSWTNADDSTYERPSMQPMQESSEEVEADISSDQKETREGCGRTIFVNASNYCLPPKAVRRRELAEGIVKMYPPTGGVGYQPVIVDLKDRNKT